MKKLYLLAVALIAIGTITVVSTPSALAQARVFGNASNGATATAGAATLDKQTGTITSEAISTAAAGIYTLTLTNSVVKDANSIVFASVSNGSNTGGNPVITRVTPAAGSVVIVVQNVGATAFSAGTIKITFCVLAP